VDVEQFAPRERAEARAGVRALQGALASAAAAQETTTGEHTPGEQHQAAAGDAFARDPAEAARAFALVDPERDRLVAFVGKLIVSKGVDLLVAAWPLVLAREPRARLVIVGFGAFRDGLGQLIAALAAGDLDAALALARAGRSLEAGSDGDGRELGHLTAFLTGLAGDERERYLAAAATLTQRIVLTGRLEHDELAALLPACEAVVVPSTFPEAFGMVAAEAAACAALPISAAHSGLAEVSGTLAAAVPPQAAQWLSFAVDDEAVRAIADALGGWLGAGADLRERTRAGLVATVRQRWSWEGVARGVLAAAQGELDALGRP
jgi:glycosyltransferase involved in cell wall biosynthesis